MQSLIDESGSQTVTYSAKEYDYQIDYPGGRTDYSNGNICPSGLLYGYKAGVALDNFHKRVREGELLPHTPYRRFTLEADTPSGEFHVYTYRKSDNSLVAEKHNAPWTNGSHIQADWFLTRAQFETIAEDYSDFHELVQAVVAKVNNAGHDTLTFLSELAKVKRMFVNLLKSILRLDIPKDLHSFSSRWLEARYGWRTLLFDLEDLEKAVAGLASEQLKRVTDRVGTTNSWVDTYDEVTINTSANVRTFSYVDNWTVGKRGSVSADFEAALFRFNVAQTAWELVPFSFVIDWIVNIGQLIAALSFVTFSGKYSASGGLYLELQREIHCDQTYIDNATYKYTHDVFSDTKSTMRLWLREPTPVSYLPQFRLNLDEFKVADLVALVIQKFS